MAKKDFVFGFMACAAVAALAPVAILLAAGTGRRPLVRALARGGSVLSEKTRETLAELQEITEDFVAEMRGPVESIVKGTGATAAAGSSVKDPGSANGQDDEAKTSTARPRRQRRASRRRPQAAA